MIRICTTFLTLVMFLSAPSHSTMTQDQQNELVNRVMSAPEIPTFGEFKKGVKKDPVFKGLFQGVMDILYDAYYQQQIMQYEKDGYEIWTEDQIADAGKALERFSEEAILATNTVFQKHFEKFKRKVEERIRLQKEMSAMICYEFEGGRGVKPKYLFRSYNTQYYDPTNYYNPTNFGGKGDIERYALERKWIKKIYDEHTRILDTIRHPMLRAVCENLRSKYITIDEPLESIKIKDGGRQRTVPLSLRIAIMSSQISLLEELKKATDSTERTNPFLSAQMMIMNCLEAETLIEKSRFRIKNYKKSRPGFDQARTTEKFLHSQPPALWSRLLIVLDSLSENEIRQLIKRDILPEKPGPFLDPCYEILYVPSSINRDLDVLTKFILNQPEGNRSGVLWLMKAICYKRNIDHMGDQAYGSWSCIRSINEQTEYEGKELGILLERELTDNRPERQEFRRKEILSIRELLEKAPVRKSSTVEKFTKNCNPWFEKNLLIANCLNRVSYTLDGQPDMQLMANLIACQYLLENLESIRRIDIDIKNKTDPWMLEIYAILQKSKVTHAENIRTFFEKVLEQSKSCDKSLKINEALVNLHVGLSILADQPSQAQEHLQKAEDLSIAALEKAREEKVRDEKTLSKLKPFTRDKLFFSAR